VGIGNQKEVTCGVGNGQKKIVSPERGNPRRTKFGAGEKKKNHSGMTGLDVEENRNQRFRPLASGKGAGSDAPKGGAPQGMKNIRGRNHA